MRSVCFITLCTLLFVASGAMVLDEEDETPDGRIAFIGKKDGSSNIYIVNGDGSGLSQVTEDPEGLGATVSIAPSGKKLVTTIQGKLILFDLEDGSRKELASRPAYFPTWSPDGERIAFACSKDSLSTICTVDTAGHDLKELTEGYDAYLCPTWGSGWKEADLPGKGLRPLFGEAR
ncbi:MAG: TolB family protein [Flavobacteriales bacterium]